jgi:hypothetical protein
MWRAASAPLVLCAALGLAGLPGGLGCGTGGGAGTGSVALLVTDAPSDDFERIELVISKVELLGDARVEIFSGRETVDLRALASFSNPLFVAKGVPVGAYEKVRLTIEDVSLVPGREGARRGNRVAALHLEPPGSGRIDLVPRGSFFVVPGATLLMEIDVDAEKAIQADVPQPGGYGIRPVAFVRVVEDDDPVAKPARVHGVIDEFLGPLGFALCSEEIRATRRADPEAASTASCLAVNLSDETRVHAGPGEPLALDDLAAGDAVTVVGEIRLRRGVVPLATRRGRSTGEVPFALAELDGADLQLDALAVERGPKGRAFQDAVTGFVDLRAGALAELDPAGRRFELSRESERECVEVVADAQLLLLADDGRVASASEISLDDLVDGQSVEVFGAPGESCFEAEALVAVAAAGGVP